MISVSIARQNDVFRVIVLVCALCVAIFFILKSRLENLKNVTKFENVR